ncbi:MAG: hypothetical protein AAF439_10390 [Pseudomonadota bacterium]
MLLTVVATAVLVVEMERHGESLIAWFELSAIPISYALMSIWLTMQAAIFALWCLATRARLRQWQRGTWLAFLPPGLMLLAGLGSFVTGMVLLAEAPADSLPEMSLFGKIGAGGGMLLIMLAPLSALLLLIWVSIRAMRPDPPPDSAVFD